ncbi:lytic transglycosylase domain-containing protein [Rossellomorea vietnamensis]|uniref:Lytic transglycosylase domain-containing protein n=1 Tax=Rossellomorea vietnamensis TaxID=218284 RepID=A0A5D4LZE7_9BACI|nr:S-layer homology domain-containing protein [Rossellomorea vietnamensis]TYR94876.1 lytic transglycosylase domain-containing protein [Rossellomorea vietnamensis]
MNKFFKKIILLTTILWGGVIIGNTEAETVGEYSKTDVKEMIREVALAKKIPPEILKAIALSESGELKHFNDDGTPFISEDGGIGLMQITLTEKEIREENIDVEKLKWDIRYNIEIAAYKLNQKWGWDQYFLPTINQHDRKYLEDWYFAVMAYNGLSKANDPGLYGDEAYPEKVYQYIRDNALQDVGETPALSINYEAGSNTMKFPIDVDRYDWPTSIRTSQDLEEGDVVYTWNPDKKYSKLRKTINSAYDYIEIFHDTPLKIVGGPYETENEENLYVMYEVEGNGVEGYISSSNIIHSEKINVFPDIIYGRDGEVPRAVSFLQQRSIINGHDDGTFKPDDDLLRRHAAKLIVHALDLKLPQGYTMKGIDMEPGDLGYEDMLIAEAHGLIVGNEGILNPNGFLKRSQMAKILVRAYDDVYEKPTAEAEFSDRAEFWNYEDINTLKHNGITVADPFRSFEDVTRWQFSLFLERSIRLEEKK